MRMKDKIEQLNTLSRDIDFPETDSAYARYVAGLRYVICDHIGFAEGQTLDFDAEAQEFYFEARTQATIGGKPVEAVAYFRFSPYKDLLAEVMRVASEFKAFQAACWETQSKASTAAEVASAIAEADADAVGIPAVFERMGSPRTVGDKVVITHGWRVVLASSSYNQHFVEAVSVYDQAITPRMVFDVFVKNLRKRGLKPLLDEVHQHILDTDGKDQ